MALLVFHNVGTQSHQCNVSVLDAKQALQIVLGTTAQGDIVYCFLSCTCLV